ncbi:helix-turn-helix transcriptional regulator [Candidatus Dojkabacteria bacterium]|nr:helix-turn-helix transcriptional regulator [Candidatus Dojkabacteria bacterium]
MLEEIGTKIRDARESQAISQKDLGMALGLSDKAVSAYEAGRTIPPLETLVRIAEELNKPLDYFIQSNANEYKLETRIAAMEQVVIKLLSEIHKIQDYLKIPQERIQSSDPSPKQ